jgi:ubiquinone/menaquinone biosynthesis C-methylase UbiE
VSFWSERVLPHAIEKVCGGRVPFARRSEIVPLASGTVLDVGVGSGLNLPHADGARIERWVGIDPSYALLDLARERARRVAFGVELILGRAETLPFEDGSFDTVLVTYTFCSVAEPATVVREIARVIAVGGRVLFVEHGVARTPVSRAIQRGLDPIWGNVAGGCSLRRDFVAALRSTGRFEIESLRANEAFPKWMSTVTSGAALVRSEASAQT